MEDVEYFNYAPGSRKIPVDDRRYEITNLFTPFLVSVLGDSLRHEHTLLFGARHIAGTDLDLSLEERITVDAMRV